MQTECRQNADRFQTDFRQISDIFQAQFDEHAYQFRTIRFWIAETRLGRQDLHDKICTGRSLLDDLNAKILVILDKSLFEFESSHSIAERLLIANSTVLRHLHDSICFKSFHLHWVLHLLTDDLCEKRKSMQKLCCYACMLPHVITGIILWLVMSRDFSSIYHHLARGLCQEMIWSQNRDWILRATNSCLRSYGNRTASVMTTDCEMIPKWTAPILWQIYLFHLFHLFRSNKRSFLDEGRRMKKTCGSSRQLLCSHKSGFNRLAWRKCILRMPYQSYSPDLAPSDFYLFPTVKGKLERIQLADKDQLFECLQEILRYLDQQELNTIFQAWVSRVQEVSEGNRDYVRW
jgi:hypothetical protein